MRLPGRVYRELERYRVHVSYVDRKTAKFWNEFRGSTELRHFGGFYWWREGEEDRPFGPYRSYSAAMREAYTRVVQGYGDDLPIVPNQISEGGRNVETLRQNKKPNHSRHLRKLRQRHARRG